MRYAVVTTEQMPSVLTAEEVAGWLRIVPTEEDSLQLYQLVQAAQEYIEDECKQPLFQRTYTATLPGFSSGYLPGKVVSDLSISYLTAAGLEGTALDAAGYLQTGNTLSFLAAGLPSLLPYSVSITYKAGYPPDQVPAKLKQAILAHVAYAYDNRANPVSERVTLVDRLIDKYKLYNC